MTNKTKKAGWLIGVLAILTTIGTVVYRHKNSTVTNA